eukprot:1324722-Amorphochlora_amoeboformis.AAC.1
MSHNGFKPPNPFPPPYPTDPSYTNGFPPRPLPPHFIPGVMPNGIPGWGRGGFLPPPMARISGVVVKFSMEMGLGDGRMVK